MPVINVTDFDPMKVQGVSFENLTREHGAGRTLESGFWCGISRVSADSTISTPVQPRVLTDQKTTWFRHAGSGKVAEGLAWPPAAAGGAALAQPSPFRNRFDPTLGGRGLRLRFASRTMQTGFRSTETALPSCLFVLQ